MRIAKGDKVKCLDLEGTAISNPYMYISDMEVQHHAEYSPQLGPAEPLQ